jgi:hypothetical protein
VSRALKHSLCCLRGLLLPLQLHAAYSGSINMQGFLLKHRPVTQLMGLFAQEWEMRWAGVCELLMQLACGCCAHSLLAVVVHLIHCLLIWVAA